MEPLFIALSADAPVRPPDWRPRLAAALHEARLAFVATRPSQVPDELVRKLLTRLYGWGWDAPTDDEWTGLQAATAWYATASIDAVLEVQARLLAGQTDESIAAAVVTAPAVVKYYELLYFACRDRLRQPSFVLNTLLNAGTPTPTLADAVRRAAYRFGPLAVDLFLAAARGAGGIADAPPTTAAEFAAAAERAAAHRWLAVECVPRDYSYRSADVLVLNDMAARRIHGAMVFTLEPITLYPNPKSGQDVASDDGVAAPVRESVVESVEGAVAVSALSAGPGTGYTRTAEKLRVRPRRLRPPATEYAKK